MQRDAGPRLRWLPCPLIVLATVSGCGGSSRGDLRVTVDLGGVTHPGEAQVYVLNNGKTVATKSVRISHSVVFRLPAGSYEVQETYRGRPCLHVVDNTAVSVHSIPNSGAAVELTSKGWNLTFLCDS